MSFKSIGQLAGVVLREAELAARASKSRTEFEGGDEPRSREGKPGTRRHIARHGEAPRELNMAPRKEADAETPASASRGGVKQGGNRSANLPTIGRDMIVARNAEPQGVRHEARPARVSATIISLAIYRASRHDLTVPW